jgi:hypothetical protein
MKFSMSGNLFLHVWYIWTSKIRWGLLSKDFFSALLLPYAKIYSFIRRRPMLKCCLLETQNAVRFQDLETWLACLVSGIYRVADHLCSGYPVKQFMTRCNWVPASLHLTTVNLRKHVSVFSAFLVLLSAYERRDGWLHGDRTIAILPFAAHFCYGTT